jgi:hypothetical protein
MFGMPKDVEPVIVGYAIETPRGERKPAFSLPDAQKCVRRNGGKVITLYQEQK